MSFLLILTLNFYFFSVIATSSSIFEAIREGSIPVIENILLSNFDSHMNSRNSDGYTPLHYAVSLNKTEEVIFLLENHADLHMTEIKNGWTSLHLAVALKNQVMTALLLDFGASHTIADKNGNTPLCLAVDDADSNDKVGMILLLLGSWANPNQRCEGGELPLHKAIKSNDMYACRLLVENGADINLKNNDGLSAVEVAKQHHNTALANEITRVYDGAVSRKQDSLKAEDKVRLEYTASMETSMQLIKQLMDENKLLLNEKETCYARLAYAM
mmetsp:Transcript_9081/g.12565  ORF Transcript_9081/g.12565 Transcript_9081/m.12565 type:complete len:272 (+) Transcript_9081:62-877(+)